MLKVMNESWMWILNVLCDTINVDTEYYCDLITCIC